MGIEGKNMNEWLLEQVHQKEDELSKKEKEVFAKEEEIQVRDESIKWIKWTVPVSLLVILIGFYVISRPGDDTMKTSVTESETSVEWFKASSSLDFAPVLQKQAKDSRFAHIWGKENMKFSPQHELKVFFPKGSFSPSSDPRWGGGFIYKLDEGYETARLSYKVKFEKGFDFVKGGKLPGFCSLDCPRGGSDVGDGFSTRFMWRKYGDLEGYLYIPGKEGAYGKSYGRGSYRFEAGKYYKLEQSLKLNTPGQSDGSFAFYVNGEQVFRDDAVKFREKDSTKIDSVIFSTFFGGSDGSFASSEDTYAYFKDFTVWH